MISGPALQPARRSVTRPKIASAVKASPPMTNLAKNFLRHVLDSRLAATLIESAESRADNRMRELGMIAQAFEFARINGVRGDYFEFGLWQGKTFRYAWRMKHRYKLKDVKLWGFDSFEGLPAIDDATDNIWKPGQFAYGEAELRKRLLADGFRPEEFDLVAGYYDQSLDDGLRKRLQGRKAAVVYVDCDLYESTKPVLAFIKDFVVNGTIVCFDDFYNYKGSPNQGEQRALDEFLQENPAITFIPYLDYSPLGKSFIVRIGDKNSD